MKTVDKTEPEKPKKQPAWEYKSRRMDLDADLTQYGQEGWELVAVTPLPHDPSQTMYHFKRRKD
jgi:hypothetical protein